MVQTYFTGQLRQYLDMLDQSGLSRKLLEHAREEVLDHESFDSMESSYPQWLPVSDFKQKMGVSDAEWDASLPRIVMELRKGRRDMLRAVLEAAERQDGYSFGAACEQPSTAPLTPVAASALLGKSVEEFIAEHSRQWPEKTTKQVQAYLHILIEYFGHARPLGTIRKQDASEVKKVLQQLPASRNTIPALKGIPLLDVVTVKGYSTISPKTINSHIDSFRRFFDWAERHGHAPHRLFEGMKVPKAKEAATERRPFTKEQARLIFTELTENTSGLVRSESHKWGSLLGLFTGARLNEICQLEVSDIQEDSGIWFIAITDEGDNKKRVKERASRRKVPLHSELMKLGFLDFKKSREGHTRLFPDYSYYSNGGYGRSLGRWYNESFLPKLELKRDELVFHSLRHTMVTRLGQAGVPEPIYQCIVGHAREGVTQEVYLREGYTLGQLSEAIEKFKI